MHPSNRHDASGQNRRNHRTYNSPDVVFIYARRRGLQPPESSVYTLLRPRLKQMAMLDIGVGGGRTTEHFLDQVSEYIAIDYCPRMVHASRRRFPAQNGAFQVGDVRAMTAFPSARFDFVLYSYNGIDYMGHRDRLRALGEIRRVMRSGGSFCFSSHNLRAVPQGLWPQKRSSAKSYLAELVYRARLRLLNPSDTFDTIHSQSYQIIRDLPRLLTYYISPAEQLRQLADAGFGAVRLFDLRGGRELANVEEAERAPDTWIYYLCEAM